MKIKQLTTLLQIPHRFCGFYSFTPDPPGPCRWTILGDFRFQTSVLGWIASRSLGGIDGRPRYKILVVPEFIQSCFKRVSRHNPVWQTVQRVHHPVSRSDFTWDFSSLRSLPRVTNTFPLCK